jgi:chromosome partitioning protein
VVFAEAAAVGKAVFELEPDSAASKEISALVNEIMEQSV